MRDPQRAAERYGRGVDAFRRGASDEALAAFAEAVQADPTFFRAHAYAALCHAQAKRWEEAVASLRSCLEVEPGYAKAHNQLGECYRRTGKMQEAIGAFRRAASLDPGRAEYWYNLALTYTDLKQPDDACEPLEKAFEAAPDDAEIASELATNCFQRNAYDAARGVLDRFLQKNADHPRAMEFRIRLKRIAEVQPQ